MKKQALSEMTEDDHKVYKKKLLILIGLYLLLFAIIAALIIVIIQYSKRHMLLPAYSTRRYAAQVCVILFATLIPIIWFISNIKSDIKRMTRKPELDFDNTELDESEYEAERLEAARANVKEPLTPEEKTIKRFNITRNILIAIALIILLIVIIIITADSYFERRSGLRLEFIIFTIFILSVIFIPPIALLHFVALNKEKQIKK